jgi:hypothetical protein
MKNLNTAGAALMARLVGGEQIPLVQLVEMQFGTGTVYLSTAGLPLTWDGHAWVGIGIGITAVDDGDGEFGALQFTLSGVTSEQLALALSEDVQGVVVRVYCALVDPDTGTVADAVRVWSGELDVPAIEDGPTASVSINAEHRGAIALRPKPGRYTHDAQSRLYPGDACLDFDPATDAPSVVWPAASWFAQ